MHRINVNHYSCHRINLSIRGNAYLINETSNLPTKSHLNFKKFTVKLCFLDACFQSCRIDFFLRIFANFPGSNRWITLMVLRAVFGFDGNLMRGFGFRWFLKAFRISSSLRSHNACFDKNISLLGPRSYIPYGEKRFISSNITRTIYILHNIVLSIASKNW